MSLSLEQFLICCEERRAMEKRLQKLLGFDPTNSDHYGRIHLYNQIIHSGTTDEEILEIRAKFVKWRDDILAIFAELGHPQTKSQISELFYISAMWGTMYFLGVIVDIDKPASDHRNAIKLYVTEGKIDYEKIP